MADDSAMPMHKVTHRSSTSFLKQCIREKQNHKECMNDSCRRQLENYKTALNHIARSFYDTYNIINAQDQSQAQLLRSVKRITEELGVPLDLSFKHEEEVRNKRMSVKNMANTIRRNYELESGTASKRTSAGRAARIKNEPTPGPSTPSVAQCPPAAAQDSDDDCVIISDDEPSQPGPAVQPSRPLAPPRGGVLSVRSQNALVAPVRSNVRMDLSPLTASSTSSSPPSLASELETGSNRDFSLAEIVDMMPDLEQQPAPTRRLGRITSVTAGHGGAANMYTVDNGRSHFYGSDEVLAVLSTRLDLHPISLPPSTRVNNSAPELRVLRATTTFPGPRQCLVTLEFEYQRKFDNQSIALYYYLKSTAENEPGSATWDRYDQSLPCYDNCSPTVATLLFGEIEEDEVLMLSCRMTTDNGRMGPFSVPFAVRLSRPSNGSEASTVFVNRPMRMPLSHPQIVRIS